ncbi:NAD(P)H-hydrate epimerase [Naasia lichenicola]|uniref:NAD(P)H-hydrate epimerase n=1 Tax=Naasia lichenicola TaxID=2565933 RepID=A0A4S4FN88_9MICO|nr:NAD(P)H-hydrate epimerase [Naasia lichenicola]THG31728.1 NAD(P)H-hydrate epimerase [Naasia lichenicola]
MADGYSAAQVQAAERPLLDAGVPLMQRAADGLAAEIDRELDRTVRPRSVVVLVGSGNNGGDALYAAARLADHVEVLLVLLSDRVHEAGLAAALQAGAETAEDADGPWSIDRILARARAASILVDGILGTGSAGRAAPRGIARGLLEQLSLVREELGTVVAVDLPSGVDPDDGSIPGVALRADVTVTFGAVKAGLLLAPGRDHAGEVRLIDIGLDMSRVEPTVRTER